jgi:hypothetical protein
MNLKGFGRIYPGICLGGGWPLCRQRLKPSIFRVRHRCDWLLWSNCWLVTDSAPWSLLVAQLGKLLILVNCDQFTVLCANTCQFLTQNLKFKNCIVLKNLVGEAAAILLLLHVSLWCARVFSWCVVLPLVLRCLFCSWMLILGFHGG